MSAGEENVSEKPSKHRVPTVKSTMNNIWRPEYKKPLYDLIETTDKLVSHTYLFTKIIFIKELRNNDAFKFDVYVNKSFFVEVCLALIDRNVRDGSKTGKTRLTEKVATYRSLIAKHRDAYFEVAKYRLPKLVNALQIALYECTKINTACLNNLKAHFGNRLRMSLNYLCNKKEESFRLRKPIEEERYLKAKYI